MKKKFRLSLKGRVMVFIDAANILYSQRDLGWRIDYKKLKEYLEKVCDLRGICYYTGKVGTLSKQLSFLRRLEGLGYKVKAKEVKMIKIGRKGYLPKGNLDVELALDAYRQRRRYETMVLLSGDSDFAYLLDLLIEEKKEVLVMSARGHVARELLKRSKYVSLVKLRNFIEFRDSKSPLRGS